VIPGIDVQSSLSNAGGFQIFGQSQANFKRQSQISTSERIFGGSYAPEESQKENKYKRSGETVAMQQDGHSYYQQFKKQARNEQFLSDMQQLNLDQDRPSG
jgi:hypothetical protein